MIKHLEGATSSRDLRWTKIGKVYEKNLNEFKRAKVNCQRKPQGQTGKKTWLLYEKGRKQNKNNLFSISVKFSSQTYLGTPQRIQPSQAPSVLV